MCDYSKSHTAITQWSRAFTWWERDSWSWWWAKPNVCHSLIGRVGRIHHLCHRCRTRIRLSYSPSLCTASWELRFLPFSAWSWHIHWGCSYLGAGDWRIAGRSPRPALAHSVSSCMSLHLWQLQSRVIEEFTWVPIVLVILVNLDYLRIYVRIHVCVPLDCSDHDSLGPSRRPAEDAPPKINK